MSDSPLNGMCGLLDRAISSQLAQTKSRLKFMQSSAVYQSTHRELSDRGLLQCQAQFHSHIQLVPLNLDLKKKILYLADKTIPQKAYFYNLH